MKSLNRKPQSGVALVLIMIILVIATMIGVWGFSTWQSSQTKASNRLATNKLQLTAEEGLQKTTRRIQEIINYPGDLTDSVGQKLGTARTRAFLLGNDSLCMPPAPPADDTVCPSPACPDAFNASDNFDVVSNANHSAVICNFLGTTMKNAQVSLVRKTDVVIGANERTGVFLVNVIAKDSNDRRQVIQGVVIVPYNPDTGSPTEEPYLATISKGGS